VNFAFKPLDAYVHSVDDTVRLCFVSLFSSALFCRNTTPDRMFFCLHYSRTSTNLGYVLHLFIDVNTFHALRSVNNSAQANNEFYVSVCGGKIFYVYSWAYLEAVLGAKCPHVDAVQLNTANVLSISSNYTHAVCFETRSYDKILFNSIYAYILFNFWVKIGSITILTKK